jgi:diguanylate cyclase (GGDEF)-like protein
MAENRPHRSDIFLHHKDGHRVPAETRVCPVTKDGKIVGAVEIFNDNSRQRAVRERAAELTKLAFLDPASQVANRRYLDQQLSQQLDQYSKGGTPFGIILADLDGFKNVNDTYGHVTGDVVLLTVAKTMSCCFRGSDVLGRWGGDEFLVILPGVTKDVLESTSERCRALVGRCTVPMGDSPIQVTISAGTAMVAPGDSPDSLLTRADQRLYDGKQSRRCRHPGL